MWIAWVTAIVVSLLVRAAAASDAGHVAALNSITAGELYDHVAVLADDTYEGRAAGTRGSRAAARYIVSELERSSLQPAGDDGGYYQTFDHRGTAMANMLVLRPGSDPALRDEVIVVGGHYDHVGYGTPRNSFGPVGQIHNGADDNASGVSTILEVIEALELVPPTRRSILFAFWDGEEIDLLGSKHWIAQPTVPLERVRLMLNLDMVGRLREGRLEVLGARTGYGMRQLLSGQVEDPLWLDFALEYKSNSDHWPFYNRGIPAVIVHTGLHDDYHRPRDDAERINQQGMQAVSQYVLSTLVKAANADRLPDFREESRRENARTVAASMRPAPPPPPRIGIRWAAESSPRLETDGEPASAADEMGQAEASRQNGTFSVLAGSSVTASAARPTQTIRLTEVTPGSPAAQAGLRRGDRVVALNGEPIRDAGVFHRVLLAAAEPVRFSVERGDDAFESTSPTVDFIVQPAGPPVRLGIVWREDDAERGSVFLTHVVPRSPADDAGLKVHDRIYAVDGEPLADQSAFTEAVTRRLDQQAQRIVLLVESRGRVRDVAVMLAPDASDGSGDTADDGWRPSSQ